MSEARTNRLHGLERALLQGEGSGYFADRVQRAIAATGRHLPAPPKSQI